jgi:hypothetical protein
MDLLKTIGTILFDNANETCGWMKIGNANTGGDNEEDLFAIKKKACEEYCDRMRSIVGRMVS